MHFRPYISSIVQISSRNSTLSVHHSTLEPYPKLLLMIQTARATRSIRLNVSGKTAHVLVHFMYTGAYEHLPFNGSDPQEWQHSEFATCLECYAAALEYELNDLVPLMQKTLKRLGADIAISKFIAIVEDTYPRSISGDKWFSSFVDDCVQQAFDKFNVCVDEKTLGELEERKTIASMIMRNSLIQSEAIHAQAFQGRSRSPKLTPSDTSGEDSDF